MARSNNGSVSAYAQFENDKGVKGIGTFVPRELYNLMTSVRPETADGAIIKEALVEFVNARRDNGMSPASEIPAAYVQPGRAKKESAEDKAKREAREAREAAEATAKELADAKAEIAALKALIPTPPVVIADAATGKVRAK